jgi:hypothetical protein
LPTDQLTTLQAPPLARTFSGSGNESINVNIEVTTTNNANKISHLQISTGYSHGTVNQVMPKKAVNKKINTVPAAPNPCKNG